MTQTDEAAELVDEDTFTGVLIHRWRRQEQDPRLRGDDHVEQKKRDDRDLKDEQSSLLRGHVSCEVDPAGRDRKAENGNTSDRLVEPR
ncbi:MAG: hypothetical protein ACR2KT_15385 [Methylocella sp.]